MMMMVEGSGDLQTVFSQETHDGIRSAEVKGGGGDY